VGAFLAQKVSEYLPNKPLVLLLPQPQYGGRIEITEDDFQQMALSVELKAKTINRRRPRLLILDDSVLSGSSLFTMLGIASNLNLNTKGVLVLLNRLSPEISESINLLPIKFAYLYRLHMPVPKSEEYPDLMLYNINNIYKKGSKSLIGLKWAHNLNEYEDESYFLKNVDKMIIDNIVLPEHERKKIETNNDQVYHIIQQLILNPDIGKIDIMTRVGIVFNFQEKLVTDDAFWNLLKILFEHGKDAENCFSSILFFLQKVIYILTFSKHTDSDKAHESFIRFCEDIVFASLNNNNWTNLVPIVCQCLMAMGIKKAPSLIRCLSCFSEEILLNALPSLDEDSLPKEDTESGSNKLKEKSAFQIVASYAWSLGILGLANDNQVFNNAKFKNIDEITNNINSIEERMLMIDLLQPSLDNNKSLRELLGINTWRFREKQLKLLLSKGENGNDNHILKYLKEAPGYYGILKSLIFLCKASTVLLYSKNKSETGFYLRVYETSFKKTPARDLKADDLTPEVIPRAIRTRMAAKLFFCSDSNDQIVSFIDKYTTGASHCACFGAPINTENDEIDYYILVGFTQLISPQHLSTAFYYWLRYEFLLRDILPAVHSKYVTSGTTWNAITQSITPIHTQTCIEDSARTVIRLATALLDLGTLLRRAVNLNTQSPIRLRDLWVIIHNISEVFIYEKITEAYELIRHFTNSPNMDQISMPFSIDKAKWPVRCNPLLASYFEKEVMISFPLAAREFVLYESICNSLSFFNKIDTSGDEKSIICRLSFDFKSKIPKISVSILNPYAPIQEECFTDRNQKGRIASDAAIRAIGGTYFSGGDINTKIWTTEITIPIYIMPEELVRIIK
jgi:hypothetical protein